MPDVYVFDDAVPPYGGAVNNIPIGKRPEGTYACALLALLDEEQGADVVADLIQKAEEGEAAASGGVSIYMSAIQVLEVYYDRIRVKGLPYANTFLKSLYASAIKIVHEVSLSAIHIAGRLKTSYRISLADSIACAIALSMTAALVTADHKELEPVEKSENMNVLWFR